MYIEGVTAKCVTMYVGVSYAQGFVLQCQDLLILVQMPLLLLLQWLLLSPWSCLETGALMLQLLCYVSIRVLTVSLADGIHRL